MTEEYTRLQEIVSGDAELSDEELRTALDHQFSIGKHHPTVLFEHALTDGNTRRARIIADLAPAYLRGAEKLTFARRVAAVRDLLPKEEEKHQARKRLQELDYERRQSRLGNALQERVADQKARNARKGTTARGGGWNLPTRGVS